jgi:hypothetical protein
MYLLRLWRLIQHFTDVTPAQERVTVDEVNRLPQLSEAVIEYSRMVQSYYEYRVPLVIVETLELAHRFRETPEAIESALQLLRETGRAEPTHLRGCWRVRVESASVDEREAIPPAKSSIRRVDNDEVDLGAA